MPRARKLLLLSALASLLAGAVLAQSSLPFGGSNNAPGGGFGGRGGRGGRGGGGFGGGGGYGGGPVNLGGGGTSTGSTSGNIVRLEGGGFINEDTVKTARETVGHSVDLPTWSNPPGLKNDTFTFTRVIFHGRPGGGNADPYGFFGGGPGGGGGYGGGGFGGRGGRGGRGGFGGFGGGWDIDYPDADLNVSYRLHQFTTMKVDPDCRVVKLTDPALDTYPLIYMEHVENMLLTDDEVAALRKYLQSGGTLLVNDTWGDAAFANFANQMKRVLPDSSWSELGIDHPLFHDVFDLKGPIDRLQVPTIQRLNYDYDPSDPNSRPSAPRQYGWQNVHFRVWYDDHKNISILFINNSDVSDGWEREGENETYFHLFSEKIAYPLAVNIVYYFMTH